MVQATLMTEFDGMMAAFADLLRTRGERHRLWCHADVVDALRAVCLPSSGPDYGPPAWLSGIDVFIDESCAEGEWRLCRAAPDPVDDEVIASGVLRQPNNCRFEYCDHPPGRCPNPE
jgi:hypothetical protein